MLDLLRSRFSAKDDRQALCDRFVFALACGRSMLVAVRIHGAAEFAQGIEFVGNRFWGQRV